MGSLAVLDTNVVIYLVNGQLRAPLPLKRFLVSVITRIELLGWKDLGLVEEAAIRKVLGEVREVGLEEAIILQAIELRKSTSLRVPDAIVAATALVTGADLVTLDKTFLGVPGLNLLPIEIQI